MRAVVKGPEFDKLCCTVLAATQQTSISELIQFNYETGPEPPLQGVHEERTAAN